MALLREIVFDCAQPARLARFWASLLDGFDVRPYDAAEIARLAKRGLTPASDTNVMVDGPGLKLCFQQTSTPSAVKNKLHLDVITNDRAAVVKRLCQQDASVVQEFDDRTWMRDPEDNDFCLADPR